MVLCFDLSNRWKRVKLSSNDMWNVWNNGRKVNAHGLNEQQARKMARLLNFNYGGDAKAIKEHASN